MALKVSVLGAGSWGTALSMVLARKNIPVVLWGRRKEHIEELNKTRENSRYLPGVKLPENLKVTNRLDEAVEGSEYIVMVVPSHAMKGLCKQIKPLVNRGNICISAAKGIETTSLKRMSQVIKEELEGKIDSKKVAVLSGPSHAEEVAKNLPTTIVAAAEKKNIAEKVQDLFITERFRVYTNPDVIGVELGGALKNIIALGAGVADGLGFGDNTKAALMTRGIAEITRLGMAMGAEPLTFAGLAGVGDLIVTCTSKHSRNRRAGIKLGQGKTLEQVYDEIQMVVEGVKTTKAAYRLQKQFDVEMPITTQTYKVLFEGKSPIKAVNDLMTRVRTHEMEEVALQKNWDW